MTPLSPDQLLYVKPAVDIAFMLLKPIAQKVWNWTGDATERAKFEVFGGFNEYLQHSYQQHSYFTSLVFKNEQKKLDDYYLPLTLIKHPDGTSHKISKFPLEIMHAHNRILIVDTAGMGKSTISRFLFLTCIRENVAIPILIDLRKLSKTKTILDFVLEYTTSIGDVPKRELVHQLISAGKFLFIFDGYDEISDDDREAVANGISEFVSKAPENWYAMTSREEGSLSSFPSFQRFTIKPLEKEESYALLRLYDTDSKYADTLIAKLGEAENQNVHEFLTSPLLASLLFKSFEYKRTVPMRKHIFYRQVFEALFETHDLMKQDYQRTKRSGLDIDQFDEFLRYFCFITYRENKSEYTKVELLGYIEKTKKLLANKDINSSDVIHDLTHGVPLMIEEGNYVRWVHKSIQEYFAALWICRDSKGKQEDYLVKMFNDESLRHQNMLVLCADIDQISFRKTIVKALASQMVDEHTSSYQLADEEISLDIIHERKALTTGRCMFATNITHLQEKSSIKNKAPSPEWLELQTRFMDAMTEHCKKIGIKQNAASWSVLGIGSIRTSSDLLNIPAIQSQFPFIKPIVGNRNHESLNEVDSLKDLLFIPIDDDVNNPINQKEVFAKVTGIVAQHQFWRFDYEEAVKTLDAIRSEEEQSRLLEF